MNVMSLPWLEVAIGLAIVGAIIVSCLRTPVHAFGCGLVFTASVFLCTVLAWLNFYIGTPPEELFLYSVQPALFGRQILVLDILSAPLVPAVALLHFLTALATTRTKMRRFSLTWSLTSEAIQLSLFSCHEPWILIGLLAAGTVPPCFELLNRGRSLRIYLLHMALFVGLLTLGWALVQSEGSPAIASAWASVPLMAAILVRCGTVPAHCWMTYWFENASLGNALLFVTPLTGVYAALRIVLPVSPAWVLQGIGILSLVTAVYAAGMATVQRESRRFFAYLFLSHASLVLVGLELHTPLSLTAALCLWFSVMLSLGGFGLTLRALVARFGQLSLDRYHGLYEHSPTLAVCFLLMGLACVGFPGTLGFVSTDLLVDGSVEFNLYVGLFVVAASALNGIAVVRAYFLLFTGRQHASTISLGIIPRERVAVLSLSILVIAGGLFPQPGVLTRHEAAKEILRERASRVVSQSVTAPPTSTAWTSKQQMPPLRGVTISRDRPGTRMERTSAHEAMPRGTAARPAVACLCRAGFAFPR
jgi:NADH-quinone oxidoreductase subunit M